MHLELVALINVLLWVKVGVTLITDSDFLSWTTVNRHLLFRTRITNKTATSPTMMTSVELEPEKQRKNPS